MKRKCIVCVAGRREELRELYRRLKYSGKCQSKHGYHLCVLYIMTWLEEGNECMSRERERERERAAAARKHEKRMRRNIKLQWEVVRFAFGVVSAPSILERIFR